VAVRESRRAGYTVGVRGHVCSCGLGLEEPWGWAQW